MTAHSRRIITMTLPCLFFCRNWCFDPVKFLPVFFKLPHFLLEFCDQSRSLAPDPSFTKCKFYAFVIHIIRIAHARYLSFLELLGENRVAGASLHRRVLIFIVNFRTSNDVLKRRESIAGKLNGWVLPIQSSTLHWVIPKKFDSPAKFFFFASPGEF